MEIKSHFKNAKISAFKCREVTRAVQGLGVSQALDVLSHTSRKAARFVEKTLKTAVADAEHNFSLAGRSLFVKEALVGEGQTAKRFQPKARGSAGPVRKRTSNISIVLAVRD
jgi:large subunit ribosomal protein L22